MILIMILAMILIMILVMILIVILVMILIVILVMILIMILIMIVAATNRSTLPIESMYGIFTHIYHEIQLNEGKYIIHAMD